MENQEFRYTGSILSHPQLSRGVSLGVAPAPAPKLSLSRFKMQGSLKPKDPVATLAASLKMEPKTITLNAGALLQTQSRIRGPQYWDLRPGERPYEPVDLSQHLVEQRPLPATVECDTQIDELLPLPPEPTWADLHMKSGVDASTQVAHGSRARRARSRGGGSSLAPGGGGDALFDFDAACAPLATQLSRDVLAQALEELQREADLRALARRRGAVQGALDADAADAAAAVGATRTVAGRGAEKLATARAAYAAQISALSKASACAMAAAAVGGALGASKARIKREDGFINAQALLARNVILPAAYSRMASVLDRAAAAGGGGGSEGAGLEAVAQGLLAAAMGEALQRSRAERAAAEAALKRAEEGRQRFAIRVFVRLPREALDVEGERHVPKNFTLPGEDVVDVMDEECMPSHHAVDRSKARAWFGGGGGGGGGGGVGGGATEAAVPGAEEQQQQQQQQQQQEEEQGVEGGIEAQPTVGEVVVGESAGEQEQQQEGGAQPTESAPAPPAQQDAAAQGEGGEEARPTTAELRPETANASAFHVHYFRTVLVGPISVARYDTVGAVEGSIAAWLGSVNSRHVRRISAMAAGARLVLCLGGRRLPEGDILLGAEERVSLTGLELKPYSGDRETSVQWDLSVREEPLPSREDLGLPPQKPFDRDGRGGEGGEEGGEAEAGGGGEEEEEEAGEEGGE